MKKIMLDGQEVKSLDPESLPMLIHGSEGSGASLYTICLAAKWYSQGYKLIFLCGFSMAEKEFTSQVGSQPEGAQFFTQEKVAEFLTAAKASDNETILIIKNLELFDLSVLENISNRKNLIISGDVSKVSFQDELLKQQFSTKVFFSPLSTEDIPPLDPFHGFLLVGELRGITYLQ